ncbi:MAG: PcfJ domain-containing protein [Filomicrobium sp.]
MTAQFIKEQELEAQIQRFQRSARRRIRRLAHLSPRLADLVISFPAAAYVLATSAVAPDASGEAVRRVKDGRSLREVAEVLKLPLWLRRVPPEALIGAIGEIPNSEKFARQIANRIPQNPEFAQGWLNWVCFAGQAGHEDFALWIAAKKPLIGGRFLPQHIPLRPLAAYAWYSRQPAGAARNLIEKPWQPSMGFDTAVWAMQQWLDAITATFVAKRPRRGPGRYKRRPASGLKMIPLRTGAQLREEGAMMCHCVGDYVGLVAQGECEIFSVRESEKRVATIEIRPRRKAHGFQIIQIQGPHNSRVSGPVVEFVNTWVERYAVEPSAALEGIQDEYNIQPGSWDRLWQPYVAAKGAEGLEPTVACLEQLLREADHLQPRPQI